MGGTNKRDHLIASGQEVIWSRGYDRSSIKDITTAAGLPKGSFYHYFESKEAFAVEAMRKYIKVARESVTESATGLDALEQLLDTRIKAVISENFARECYMSVMCHAFSDQEEAFRLAVVQAIEDSNEAVHTLLARLKASGQIDPSLDVDELNAYIDLAWRGARLKARIQRSARPLRLFKQFLFERILPPPTRK